MTTNGAILVDKPVMRGIGAVSCGVYLYHLPVLHMVPHVMEKHGLAVRDECFIFGFGKPVIVMVSYWAIERSIPLLGNRT